MAARPRKSVVQNIIKNLLEMEIPEIQTASKELAEWIKQLEQHSFKLQHYATEIESWAAEEEEVDTVELTDLIKDLEATLSDMRIKGAIAAPQEIEEMPVPEEKLHRSYGRSGRVLPPRVAPRAEIQAAGETTREPVKETKSVTDAGGDVKPRVKSELPTGGKQLTARDRGPEVEETKGGYVTPEGFLIRKLRP